MSTIADTQQVAFQIALLVSLLPTLMLSGFIFPIASMPAFLQGVTHIVPARYFLIALRGIVLKGTGVGAAAAGVRRPGDLRNRVLGLASLRWPGRGPDMQRLRMLIWKEFLELRQNPHLFGVVIIAPILQLTMLGYAATTDVKDVPVVVADGDRSAASRELIARFDGSRNFTVIDTVTTVSEIEPYLETRHAHGWRWSIPSGYGADLASGTAGDRCRSSPTAPTRTPRAWRWATPPTWSAPTRRTWRRATGGGRRSAGDRGAHPRLVQPAAREPRLHDPRRAGALLLLVITTNLSSMAIVREKELGTLEQLNVTPLAAMGADRRQAAAVRR